MPISQPTIKPLPSRPQYGPEELWLFHRLTRRQYKERYGEQAPPWDKNRLRKYWFDSTVIDLDPQGPYTYRYAAVVNGQAVIQQNTITNGGASEINVPGVFEWPKYVIAPTGAKIVNATEAPLNPVYLALLEQASEIAGELGGTFAEASFGEGAHFRYDYPASEPRRVYYVTLANGNKIVAGFLLRRKYRNGVGAPGQWTNIDTSPTWIPERDEDDGEHDLRTPIPIPIRDLYPEETLSVGIAGVPVVRNRAVMPPTPDEMLATINRKVDRILDALT